MTLPVTLITFNLPSHDFSLVQGVVEEVGLIKWPAPGKAVLNTLLVILIVAGTAGLLLGINTLLTELSNAVY